MLNAAAWIAIIIVGAMVMLAIVWANSRLDMMGDSIANLESAFVDDVLDAVDEMIWPLSEEDREQVRRRVLDLN